MMIKAGRKAMGANESTEITIYTDITSNKTHPRKPCDMLENRGDFIFSTFQS